MDSKIAQLWMSELFLDVVDDDSLLIIDSWTGYKQMLQIPDIAAKKFKIITLLMLICLLQWNIKKWHAQTLQ